MTERSPHYVRVSLSSTRPVLVELDADALAEVFADTDNVAQAAILQAVATRLKSGRGSSHLQLDAIARELLEPDRAEGLAMLRALVELVDGYLAEKAEEVVKSCNNCKHEKATGADSPCVKDNCILSSEFISWEPKS